MIVLDSDVIIDLAKGRAFAVALVEAAEARGTPLATTCVNHAEILRGLGPARDREAMVELLRALDVLPLDASAVVRYGDFMHALDRAGRPIHPLDGFVAAIALANGATLATRNKKDFARVPGLSLLAP